MRRDPGGRERPIGKEASFTYYATMESDSPLVRRMICKICDMESERHNTGLTRRIFSPLLALELYLYILSG
jgi:hypothetical protein